MKINRDRSIVKFFRIFADNKIIDSAGELSYYLLFAFFPIIMVLYAALSLFGRANPEILSRFASVLPQSVSDIIGAFIEHISSKSSNISFLITGIILTVLSFSKFTLSAKSKIRDIYGNTKKASFIHEFLTSCLFTILIIVLFFITLLVMIMGEQIIRLIERSTSVIHLDNHVVHNFRYFITFLFVFMIMYVFYHIIPTVKQKISDVIYGTIFAVFGWLAVSACFTFYMNNIANLSVVYGSIGAFIILLLWFYATNIILLSGAVVNSIRYNNRISKINNTP